MDNKDLIIQATTALIEEKGDDIETITMREICKKAGVGLGLINYYFENKDKLIAICVENIIHKIVDQFTMIREQTKTCSPFEKIDLLGNMTLSFLFEHYAMAKISIMTDMRNPKENDNTHRTYLAFLPLVSSCRPDWDSNKIMRATYCLITTMQQCFLRHEVILQTYGIDLKNQEERKVFHQQMLKDILEV